MPKKFYITSDLFTLLYDKLRSQWEEASKVTQAVLGWFENLSKLNNIDDKGTDMKTKLVMAMKSDSFPSIPTDKTDTNNFYLDRHNPM